MFISGHVPRYMQIHQTHAVNKFRMSAIIEVAFQFKIEITPTSKLTYPKFKVEIAKKK